MPYLIEQDTNLPRVIARGTNSEGDEFVETESVVHAEGDVVYEDDIAPAMLERLESGEEDHLSRIAKHISEEEAENIIAERNASAPLVPEHEAEAEVFKQDGQEVLSMEEKAESNPNGDYPQDEESAEGTPDEGEQLEDHTVPELKEIAADLDIEGVSSMNKAALIEAIEEAHADGGDDEDDDNDE